MDLDDPEDDTDASAGVGVSESSQAGSAPGKAASKSPTPISEDDDEATRRRQTQGFNPASSLEFVGRSLRSQPSVSYHGQEHEADGDYDLYIPGASSPDSIIDKEVESKGSVDYQSSAAEEDNDEECEEEAEIVEEISKSTKPRSIKPRSTKPRSIKPRSTKPRSTEPRSTKSSSAANGKGIDFNLPPIDSIEGAFADMATTALNLGLDEVLEELADRQIEVGTMCSGTESPLLAFDLLSKALVENGQRPLRVHQKFAAEIEVFKQAFIERNQSPEIIFRDVREFIPEEATTATTAYGAEELIPSGLDVLIAGFVCKDLSRLNTNPKGLQDNGESGDTWLAIYSYAKRFRPTIVLLENVKSVKKTWEELVSLWDDIGYEAGWLFRDTKRYHIPQTRERMYMVAIERSHFGEGVQEAVRDWKTKMNELQRQCSTPYESWLKNMLHESSDHSALNSEVDWALCKLRYDHIRAEEGLGILRPVTKWSENGTVRPPDFANRAWYKSQSSRVYDAIDVAYLQAANKGLDQMYKMAVLDVSQNVDRFKNSLGVLPCITPNGCDFATNRQEALSGKQLLVLQGMPLNKLLFGTETQKECQDLAGNAMTTTVIGASIISAIISGSKAFRPSLAAKSQLVLPTTKKHLRAGLKEPTLLPPIDTKEIDLEELMRGARMSSRLCNCEGEKIICKYSIRVCSGCGHTACERCAGNPKHRYDASASILRSNRTLTPIEFVQKWRHMLSTRFKFGSFPDVRQVASSFQPRTDLMRDFIDRVVEAGADTHFYGFRDMQRQDGGWTVTYGSTHATLELRIGHAAEWLLFINCPKKRPGNDPLRKLLRSPVARAKVGSSLLDLKWEFSFPSEELHKLRISGVGSPTSSWRCRLGLLKYQEETVPTTLRIESHSKCKALTGKFALLSECGTASSSLYKRPTDPPLYVFLDPDFLGNSDEDSFVFSHDCTRKTYGDGRLSLASLGSSWRPWHIRDGAVHSVDTTVTQSWKAVSMSLELVETQLAVSVPRNAASLGPNADCSHPSTILEVQIPERLQVITEESWVLNRAKRRPSLSTWQSLNGSSTVTCACAPVYPHILWHVNEKGVAVPHEARQAAAGFERAIKTRAPIFHVDSTIQGETTHIAVAVNVAALVHRAEGRLAHVNRNDSAWRLHVDHAELPAERFSKFVLKSNSLDPPFEPTPSIKYLLHAQPRALSWMKTQESGISLMITEIEEAIQGDLGWRAEARAQTKVLVRGGVLADLPSFGKTVTTIALIQSEFEDFSPKVLVQNNRKVHVGEHTGALFDTAATLIVCPAHIALQWKTELEKFLGRKYVDYNVHLVQTYAELQGLTIRDIQSSKVLVLAWTVFAEENYISDLAHFSAMPQPSITGRRAFDTWFDQASRDIPDQVKAFRTSTIDDFRATTEEGLADRLQREDFKVTLPIKIQHGRAYQPHNASNAKVKARGNTQSKSKASEAPTSDQVPLIHLFRFNRLVVDEYHYLNNDKHLDNVVASVSIKRISALKRWVLSGTPALNNFSDVDQIASYLGIKLGRYHFGDGVETTQSDNMRRRDQTRVEDFLSQTETMSRQWHEDRHRRAQEFLDLFVRQNEPSLGNIPCVERIVPSELDIGHHATYLELSEYVASHHMAIKKLKNKVSLDKETRLFDKNTRLNDSLSNSATAEDALLKSALTSDGKSALQTLAELRSSQQRKVQKELKDLMAGFEGLGKADKICILYDRFKKDIMNPEWLGDVEATNIACDMLEEAKEKPNRSAFSELKGVKGEKKATLAKKRLSSLRETARDLAQHTRSTRFISEIQALLGPLTERVEGQLFKCSNPGCDGDASLAQLRLITHCGHKACEECLSTRIDAERCVAPMCNIFLQGESLVKATDLGSRTEPATPGYSGRKMADVMDIIAGFSEGEQGVIFAPNDETVGVLKTVLDRNGVPCHSLLGSKSADTAKTIEAFKGNSVREDRRKVLLLNMGSESAAGANLVNANHIIFVAPLLSKTQYEYDSAMTQAIARVRRYGQEKTEKTVYIYHMIAQRTIDVDILEHRHKRVDGITTSESTMKMPQADERKGKTKLVKNMEGHMALVPVSWLADKSKREIVGVDERPESFASLVRFSDVFEHDD
ncbi:Uu.00g144850.m01.CDS01 [Anthostomella pinea]|uniref:Uu.00g144850.m01.CDS01 n=1 Tax=Anthostomella pinea TaxID=933095 RepID=A0AAI8VRL2_9PEZI|nr:Uu.00g144850.m01.CDS01 [Anthostomella pinea]